MSIHRMSFRASTIVLLTLLFAVSALAGGILDPSFGTGGKVNFRFSSDSDDVATAAALQADGKIVAVGWSGLAGQSNNWLDSLLVRLDPDGSFDSTFGSGGMVKQDFGEEDRPSSLVLQPDGKILVGLSNHTGNFLIRYNTNGSLDTSFSNDGIISDAGTGTRLLLLQPDGKILIVGNRPLSNNKSEVALVRYNQDGSLDGSFGNGGSFYFYFGNLQVTFASGAVIQPDGKIVITGTYRYKIPGCVPTPHGQGCDQHFSYITRLTPHLLFDRKFGRRAGKEFGPIDASLGTIVLEPSGSFVINGGPGPNRYSTIGRSETGFGAPDFNILSMVRMPNGKIAGCGIYAFGWYDMGAVLFNADGSVVGNDRRDFFGGDDYCHSAVAQPDGKLVVAGSAALKPQGPRAFAIMRYLEITP